MKRGGPLRVDPEKQRAWRQRSKPLARSDIGQKDFRPRVTRRRPRRNDSGWRAEVMAYRGEVCVRCGDTRNVQADHLWPRSQGGPSVVENGLPLCGEFSRNTPGGCHPMKTAGTIVIEPTWLTWQQILWLADVGWVKWGPDGQPYGRGWKHFAPMAA